MSLLNSTPFYISEKISLIDKEFYHSIVELRDRFEFYPIDLKSDYGAIPRILILSENDNLKVVSENDIIITYTTPNLDLFSSPESTTLGYAVYSFQEVEDLWPLIVRSLEEKVLSAIVPVFDKTYKSIHLKIKKIKSSVNFLKVNELFLALIELQNTGRVNHKEINICLDDFFKDEYELLFSNQVLRKKTYKNIYPLYNQHGELLFLNCLNEGDENEIVFLYLSLFFQGFQAINSLSAERHYFESRKSWIEIPFLIKFKNGDISFNQSFSKLNVSVTDCLNFVADSQHSIQGVTYRVIIHDQDDRFKRFLFFPVSDLVKRTSQPTTQELGIISSSLAHELNNPLGGILAAINVFELDVQNEETSEQLQEMKNVVSRCKNLVETFLGFSRKDTLKENDKKFFVHEAIERAIELVRFRLMENNLQLEIKQCSDTAFIFQGNPHVFSMTFYLLFSELTTLIGHKSLLDENSDKNFVIKCEESKDSILITYPDFVSLKKSFFDSKLFTHLCDLAHLQYFHSAGNIKFMTKGELSEN